MVSGAVTLGELARRLAILDVACSKCDRTGQYRVAKLIDRYGPDAKLVDWKDEITKDCPKRANDRVALMDLCGANFPDLMKLFGSA